MIIRELNSIIFSSARADELEINKKQKATCLLISALVVVHTHREHTSVSAYAVVVRSFTRRGVASAAVEAGGVLLRGLGRSGGGLAVAMQQIVGSSCKELVTRGKRTTMGVTVSRQLRGVVTFRRKKWICGKRC